MLKPARKIYNWASQKVSSPYAPMWLGIIFFLETILFIPLDPLLMLFCYENKTKRFLYAFIATIASTLCAIVGYFIGYFLWDTIGSFIVGHLISTEFFNRLVSHYNLYENWVVLIGSFLPLPFKAIVLSAGFCQVGLISFITCVFIARGARFFGIAQLMYLWGPEVKDFVDRHFNRIVVAVGAKIAIIFTFFWVLGN